MSSDWPSGHRQHTHTHTHTKTHTHTLSLTLCVTHTLTIRAKLLEEKGYAGALAAVGVGLQQLDSV